MTAAATVVVGPKSYVVPRVSGDPAAARRLAAACRDLADAITGAQRQVTHVVTDLTGAWHGTARNAVDAPLEEFVRTAITAARRLHETADHLDAYAARLQHAHHHHGFSLHKLLVVGAITAVGLTAIVVTLGAATVVEAAAASAAVGGAIEAAGAATAADAAVAAGVDSAFADLSWLRPLARFVIPNLTQFEWGAGGTAALDEISTGRIRWRQALEAGGIAFVAGATATKLTGLLGDSARLTAAPAVARRAAPHLVEGSTWASAEATQEAITEHRFRPVDVSEVFVLAGSGSFAREELEARDLWPERTDYRREALVGLRHRQGLIVDPEIAHEMALLRQTGRELRRGAIDLRLNEGPGHTIGRHVSKSMQYLLGRVRSSRVRLASTYWDEATAKDAIEQTLAANAHTVRAWTKAGGNGNLRLRFRMPYPIGFGVDRSARVCFIHDVAVVLHRDHAGIALRTSYPVGR